jgi:hypothetical protein
VVRPLEVLVQLLQVFLTPAGVLGLVGNRLKPSELLPKVAAKIPIIRRNGCHLFSTRSATYWGYGDPVSSDKSAWQLVSR